jgi:23S rRNA pseudouridine2605 synthase
VDKTTNNAKELLALHKPKGYLVTRNDDLGRKTVYELLPKWAFDEGWMPIGRLDLDSKGLLLFTQNSKINHFLTTPKNCIKTYEIWVRGYVTDEHIAEALKGVQSPQGLLKALEVKKASTGGAKTKLIVKIDEGKNRHIRRLFGALKDPKFGTPLKVLELKRISIGDFPLDIASSEWRYLSEDEEKNLLKNFNL